MRGFICNPCLKIANAWSRWVNAVVDTETLRTRPSTKRNNPYRNPREVGIPRNAGFQVRSRNAIGASRSPCPAEIGRFCRPFATRCRCSALLRFVQTSAKVKPRSVSSRVRTHRRRAGLKATVAMGCPVRRTTYARLPTTPCNRRKRSPFQQTSHRQSTRGELQ
jgi:hypothetical protein